MFKWPWIIFKSTDFGRFSFLYLLHKFVSHISKLLNLKWKSLCKASACNSSQFCAIPRIYDCILVRIHSATHSNEIAQAEAIIDRNFAQFRAKEFRWKLYWPHRCRLQWKAASNLETGKILKCRISVTFNVSLIAQWYFWKPQTFFEFLAQTWLVPHEIVLSVPGFKPALNWNRFLAVQWRG